MARLRSRITRQLVESTDGDSARYLEGLDRRIPARTDLSASPTNAEIATAINSLYADLRENGLMEP
jgi:hypothetical protein